MAAPDTTPIMRPMTTKTGTSTRAIVRILFGLGALALTLGATDDAAAQAEQTPATTSAGIEFAAEPAVIESMGMQIYLPLRSTIQTRFVRGGQSRSIVQPTDTRVVWVMYIENKVSERDLHPAEMLDGIVLMQQEQFVIRDPRNPDRRRGSAVQVLDRTDDLEINGLQAARVYLGQPKDPDFPVTGYTMLRKEPNHYILFQFTTPPASLEQTRPIFEAMTASAHFPGSNEMREDRVEAITSGAAFLSGVTPEELEALTDDEPLFMRVFRPSSTGRPGDAEEVGYQKLTFTTGSLGELEPDKPRSRWTANEREQGFIVRQDARVVISGVVVDTRAMFYLSTDRETEMWSILIEQKSGGDAGPLRVSKTRQTLARLGPELRVRTTRPGAPPDEKVYEILEEHYISAVERYALPRLVARRHADDPDADVDLAFYNFDTGRSVVTLRRERFVATPDGGWLATTIPSEGQPEWVSTYDEAGRLIQRTAGATVFEPITRARLQRIWSGKDLPIE